MYVNQIEGMPKETRTTFFRSITSDHDIDEQMFSMWKQELQKELPSFWEEMTHRKR